MVIKQTTKAQGNSERLDTKAPKSPDSGLIDSEQKTPNCGKAKFKSCPTPPSIPPSWKTVQSIIKNHQISKTFPMILNFEIFCKAPSVGFPEKIAYRPSSIWTKTLITQLNKMSHRNTNPCFAPNLVVKSNSPDPTIVPAKMMPGPVFF